MKPPEPAEPPKHEQSWQVVSETGGRPRSKGKGKDGKDGKKKKWTCKDCGAPTAPYQSAMDQHKWSNERCLAWQRYNKLPQEEKDKENSWATCLEYAQRIRLNRSTDVEEKFPDGREPSPAWTVTSSRKGQLGIPVLA